MNDVYKIARPKLGLVGREKINQFLFLRFFFFFFFTNLRKTSHKTYRMDFHEIESE